jgi:hypothetical protein
MESTDRLIRLVQIICEAKRTSDSMHILASCLIRVLEPRNYFVLMKSPEAIKKNSTEGAETRVFKVTAGIEMLHLLLGELGELGEPLILDGSRLEISGFGYIIEPWSNKLLYL